jgi:adenine-specific DNA-methyltransferase
VAYLDDLIARIDDTALRTSLQGEVNRLKRRLNFGLVFERHLPEGVALRPAEIHPADRVFLRTDDESEYEVMSVGKSVVRLRRTADGVEVSARPKDLVMLQPLGRPAYPALTPVGEIERAADEPWHSVIAGENYFALQLLSFIVPGSVDCIYIDPPYNTGARDWTYNNHYVDDNDSYRHSKWLSFIEKRLKIAKRLLRPDGVLVITIDEHELSHLGMLLETLFPGAVRQLVTIVINPLGQARKRELARVEEYAFFVFLGDAAPSQVADDLLTEGPKTRRPTHVRWEWLLRGGTGSRRQDSPRLFFPVFIDPLAKRIVEIGEAIPLGVERSTVACPEGLVAVWPVNTNGQEGRWRCSPPYLRTLAQLGYAKVGAYDAKNDRHSILYLGKAQIARINSGQIKVVRRDGNGAVVLEGEEGIQRLVTPKTVWNRLSHRAGEYGTSVLNKLVPGQDFDFPKSVYAVLDTLRIACADKPNALVVDFFAGSGTTLHSTLLLNAEDGGKRRCILVTNNEVAAATAAVLRAEGHYPGDKQYEAQGIFESVTRPRVEAAITGKLPNGSSIEGSHLDGRPYAEGFPANANFFRLDFLDHDRLELGREFSAIAPALWMRSGSMGHWDASPKKSSSWSIPVGSSYAVLFREGMITQFRSELELRPNVTQVFLVTDSPEAYAEMVEALGFRWPTAMLYRDYLRNFRIEPQDLP